MTEKIWIAETQPSTIHHSNLQTKTSGWVGDKNSTPGGVGESPPDLGMNTALSTYSTGS